MWLRHLAVSQHEIHFCELRENDVCLTKIEIYRGLEERDDLPAEVSGELEKHRFYNNQFFML